MQQETPKMIGDFLISPFGCHAIARQYIMSLRVFAIEQPDNPLTKLITDHSSHALSVAVNHSDGEGNFVEHDIFYGSQSECDAQFFLVLEQLNSRGSSPQEGM